MTVAESRIGHSRSAARAGRFAVRVLVLPAFLIVAVLLGLAFGTVSIPPATVAEIILHKIGLIGVHGWTQGTENIIWQIRMQRVVAAALVGAALAVAGALFQAVLRNPLADPYVIGTSAGAQLGVTLAFVLPLEFSLAGFTAGELAAFVGALATVLFVYALARSAGGTPVVTLILAGFVVSSFLISATTFITYTGANVGNRLTQVIGWTMGGVQVEDWSQIGVAAPAIGAGVALAYLIAPQLNLILLGEDQAAHLGVRVERLKLGAIVLASFLTAFAVSLAGIVAFVGLVVPHAIRLTYGPGHRILLPAAMIGGAGFVVICDLMARVVIAPSEVPLGVITAILGAPFFLYLLRRGRRAYAA